jgi:hypothetical protein
VNAKEDMGDSQGSRQAAKREFEQDRKPHTQEAMVFVECVRQGNIHMWAKREQLWKGTNKPQ